MHAAQKSMENALKSDKRVETLLDTLIFRFSKVNNKKEPGSLSRAIHNSSKLKAKFGEKVQASMEGVDELIGRVYSASHAPQRFDSILLALQRIVINLDSVLELLMETAAITNELQSWASRLLDVASLQSVKSYGSSEALCASVLPSMIQGLHTFQRQSPRFVG